MKNASKFFVISFCCLFLVLFSRAVFAAENLQCSCSCTCQNIETATDSQYPTELPADIIEEITQTIIDPEPVIDELISEEEENSEVVTGLDEKILISEFVGDPVTGEKEWIELFNSGISSVDLTDWQLIEGSGQATKLTGTIDPGAYAVFEKSSLNNSGDIIILKNSTGQIIDQVSYGDWNDGNLGDNAPATADPYSVIRKNLATDSDVDSNDFAVTKTPTRNLANIYTVLVEIIEPEPVASPVEEIIAPEASDSIVETEELDLENTEADDPLIVAALTPTVIVNEILPNPVGSDTGAEWIELYNYGDQNLNLEGYILDDEVGGSSPYVITEELIIPAFGYLIFSNEQTKIILNNTTDKARLFDLQNQLISEINYTDCPEGLAYANFQAGWQWTAKLTPQAQNIYLEELAKIESSGLVKTALAADSSTAEKNSVKKDQSVVITTLEKVRSFALGTKVQVVGQVSVVPGIFSDKIIYLQGSGIQIYNSKAEWPELKEGNTVEVIGKLSESAGEKRILLSQKDDLKVLVNEESLVEPLKVTAEEIGEEKEGYLVEIEGLVVDKARSKIILADDFGEMIVYLKTGTGLSNKIFELGERLKVVGIVSQSDDEYRVLPRREADLENLTLSGALDLGQTAESKVLVSGKLKSQTVSAISVILAFLCVSIAGYFSWRYREKIKGLWLKWKMKHAKPIPVDFGAKLKKPMTLFDKN